SKAAGGPEVGPRVREHLLRTGHARVIVELNLGSAHVPEGLLGNAATILAQRGRIASQGALVLSKLPAGGFRIVHRYQTVPYVVSEACYSSTQAGTSQSFCPNGQNSQIGPGAAVPCPLPDCLHGTHVSGIAAGNGGPAGQTFSGVAKGAQLMAIQVFTKVIDP